LGVLCFAVVHGKKGFVIPTKSFVKIGIAKIFCYNNKMFGSINKTFGCCSKIFGCSNKTIFFRDSFGWVIKDTTPSKFSIYSGQMISE